MAKEAAVRAAFEQWWHAHSARITAAVQGQRRQCRGHCATTCWPASATALEAMGLLDVFQVRGIVAGFWYQTKYDFLTMMARGAKGVADAWRTSIVTALDTRSKPHPLEHKLVKFLMSDFRRGHHRTGSQEGRAGQPDQGRQPPGRRGRRRRSRRGSGG
jgi:type I restriction enzyme M protein